MRILLITSFFYPHIGGSQRYMEELYAKLIASHSDTHVDVLAYNTDQAPKQETYKGLTIYRIPCWQIIPDRFNLPNPFALFVQLFKLARHKYDFVHTHLRFFDTTWWTWIYARLIGAKSIFTEHVATTPVHQSKLVEIVTAIVDATVARWTISKYNLITVTSQATQKFLQQKMGVKKPVTVVYGGVDTQFFNGTKKQSQSIPQSKKQIKSGDIIVSFVGRLIWTKGVTYVYEAIKKMHQHLPENVYFILAGGGELEESIKQQVSKDKLSDRVYLTGTLSTLQVKEVLSNTDIVVHPSHHNEGFPNVLLEAGAAECMVIATDNAGTNELITDKKTGLLIPQKDPQSIIDTILWGLEHKQAIRNMAKVLQKKVVQEFDWKQISEEYYLLLNHNLV
ncbi:glycosyltransferase family 1 protein [Candidatus Microgenomates bacterium]|nr:MAG: glycosyltransferase family 1 protein [Candidatus Microgenomates bacterium]